MYGYKLGWKIRFNSTRNFIDQFFNSFERFRRRGGGERKFVFAVSKNVHFFEWLLQSVVVIELFSVIFDVFILNSLETHSRSFVRAQRPSDLSGRVRNLKIMNYHWLAAIMFYLSRRLYKNLNITGVRSNLYILLLPYNISLFYSLSVSLAAWPMAIFRYVYSVATFPINYHNWFGWTFFFHLIFHL